MPSTCWKARAWQFKSQKSSVNRSSTESATCRTLSFVESVTPRMRHYAPRFTRQFPRYVMNEELHHLNVSTRCWPHSVAQPAVFSGFLRWQLNCPYRRQSFCDLLPTLREAKARIFATSIHNLRASKYLHSGQRQMLKA